MTAMGVIGYAAAPSLPPIGDPTEEAQDGIYVKSWTVSPRQRRTQRGHADRLARTSPPTCCPGSRVRRSPLGQL